MEYDRQEDITHLQGQLAENPETPFQQYRRVRRYVQLVHRLLERGVGILVSAELYAVRLQLDEGRGAGDGNDRFKIMTSVPVSWLLSSPADG